MFYFFFLIKLISIFKIKVILPMEIQPILGSYNFIFLSTICAIVAMCVYLVEM